MRERLKSAFCCSPNASKVASSDATLLLLSHLEQYFVSLTVMLSGHGTRIRATTEPGLPQRVPTTMQSSKLGNRSQTGHRGRIFLANRMYNQPGGSRGWIPEDVRLHFASFSNHLSRRRESPEKGATRCPREWPVFANHSSRSFARCFVSPVMGGIPVVSRESAWRRGLQSYGSARWSAL